MIVPAMFVSRLEIVCRFPRHFSDQLRRSGSKLTVSILEGYTMDGFIRPTALPGCESVGARPHRA